MLKSVTLPATATAEDCARAVLEAWPDNLVVHLAGLKPDQDLRDFYGAMFDQIGHAEPLAEDATVGDRNSQRTGEVWMQVRYDPSIPLPDGRVAAIYNHRHDPHGIHVALSDDLETFDRDNEVVVFDELDEHATREIARRQLTDLALRVRRAGVRAAGRVLQAVRAVRLREAGVVLQHDVRPTGC